MPPDPTLLCRANTLLHFGAHRSHHELTHTHRSVCDDTLPQQPLLGSTQLPDRESTRTDEPGERVEIIYDWLSRRATRRAAAAEAESWLLSVCVQKSSCASSRQSLSRRATPTRLPCACGVQTLPRNPEFARSAHTGTPLISDELHQERSPHPRTTQLARRADFHPPRPPFALPAMLADKQTLLPSGFTRLIATQGRAGHPS
jgi:hypothetical protein